MQKSLNKEPEPPPHGIAFAHGSPGDGPIDRLPAIEFLVQAHEHDSQQSGHRNGQEERGAVDREGDDVSRAAAVHVGGVDGGGVGDGVDGGEGCGAFGWWAGDGVGDPGEDDYVAGVDAWDLMRLLVIDFALDGD